LQDRAKTVDAQFGTIAENQTLLLAKFAGKSRPNPIVDLKMTRSSSDGDNLEELDYGNDPSPDYTVEVLVITSRNPGIEGPNEAERTK
jgi:hypothetical protein